jgi:hypothetical protein
MKKNVLFVNTKSGINSIDNYNNCMGRGGQNNLLYDQPTSTRGSSELNPVAENLLTEARKLGDSFVAPFNQSYYEEYQQNLIEIYNQRLSQQPKVNKMFSKKKIGLTKEQREEAIKKALLETFMQNNEINNVVSQITVSENNSFNKLLSSNDKEYKLGFSETSVADLNRDPQAASEDPHVWLAELPTIGYQGKLNLKEYTNTVADWVGSPGDENDQLYQKLKELEKKGVKEIDYSVDSYWIQSKTCDIELDERESKQYFLLLKAKEDGGDTIPVTDDGLTLYTTTAELGNKLPIPIHLAGLRELDISKTKLQKIVHSKADVEKEKAKPVVLADPSNKFMVINEKQEVVYIPPQAKEAEDHQYSFMSDHYNLVQPKE